MTPQAKQTATTFLSSVNFILPALPHDEEVPKLKQLVFTSSDSCGSFGQCDEYLRIAERSEVFGQPQQVIDFNILRGERFNIIGLNTLDRALKHLLIFLIVISLDTTVVNAQVSDSPLQKNYFVLNSSLFVNEASLNSEKSQLIGSGHSFAIDYRRLIMNNERGSIYALIGIGDFRIGYSGWIDNNGVSENFSATERYTLLSGGFVGSLKSHQNPLDFLDLEMTLAYWRLNNQSYFINGTSTFPKAESRLSLMFYPHYSKVFDNVKFSIGPFANIDLAEFNETGKPFDLALFGLRLGLGIGF